MKNRNHVSVHGGHSKEFCNHARDTLEEIVLQYIKCGFKWVGITEHIYPVSNELRYPDEALAELDAATLSIRFMEYIKNCRLLQKKYKNSITMFTGFETETYSGYKEFIPYLIRHFQPDYIVGSVHHISVYHYSDNHIEDICIDYSKDNYSYAADSVGGIDNLYCRYFDIQYEMLKTISPAVVGHFDLIRIFDEAYPERLKKPAIWQSIIRNLELIKKSNLIMDFNLRALMKGASEPYISAPILAEAKKMGIRVVPGDDSHGVSDIGVNMEYGINILEREGFDTCFEFPQLYKWK
ncbi:MAG: histidinol-phosphatase [Desulfamplus sp.]|nr:histidinol-phosphatase [Desulfamplus sp.]